MARPEALPEPLQSALSIQVNGLTEAEVAQRKLEGLDNTLDFKPRRTTHQIVRDNTFSIFNLSLIGLAIIQLLLRDPLSALLSIGVLFLNIGLNTFQELFAKRRLRDTLQTNQPQVIAIREGRT
ncbi:MAG: hypothetical protein GTO18_00825 [Anaerolineales bacterium]|nr:hypothetical protein [Anaerolineales bacterium]